MKAYFEEARTVQPEPPGWKPSPSALLAGLLLVLVAGMVVALVGLEYSNQAEDRAERQRLEREREAWIMGRYR